MTATRRTFLRGTLAAVAAARLPLAALASERLATDVTYYTGGAPTLWGDGLPGHCDSDALDALLADGGPCQIRHPTAMFFTGDDKADMLVAPFHVEENTPLILRINRTIRLRKRAIFHCDAPLVIVIEEPAADPVLDLREGSTWFQSRGIFFIPADQYDNDGKFTIAEWVGSQR